MPLNNIADETVSALDAALTDHELSAEQKQALLDIVEKTLLKSLDEAASVHDAATKKCCGPETDMAHQIRDEVNRAHDLLKSNLSALR